MAKPRTKWSESTYERYLKDGRGQGEGADYKPWLTIHSFASKGTVSRIPGRTTGRIHHLLSRNEEYYFYLLDFNLDVLDIREQFPLKLADTLRIAREMNIRHPRYPGCSFPAVMTTDFMITRSDGYHARTIKLKKELDNPRVVEKFLVEQEYWLQHRIDWAIVTEDQINRTKAENYRWLASGRNPEEMIPDAFLRQYCIDEFLFLYLQKCLPFHAIVRYMEETHHLESGTVMAIYKSLVLEGRIEVSLDAKIDPNHPTEAGNHEQ